MGIVIYPDSTHMTISLFVPNAQEEKDVANIARASIMRLQADRFLHNMPADLQHRQTLAILQALDGDISDLTAVRNARNARPQYADNVDTRMIAENMRIYEPKGSRDRLLPVLLYLHGGGWTFGSINSCGRFCNAMAASGAVRVVALDYRLAPEFPFPDGLNDCVRAVEYLAKHAGELRIDSSRITLGGDSSGGNLALATALTEACRGKIESLLLFYPVTKAYPDGSESGNCTARVLGWTKKSWWPLTVLTRSVPMPAVPPSAWACAVTRLWMLCREPCWLRPRGTFCATKAKPLPKEWGTRPGV